MKHDEVQRLHSDIVFGTPYVKIDTVPVMCTKM